MSYTFKEYVIENFEDIFFEYISNYLEANYKIISRQSRKLKQIGEFQLSDIEILSVYVEDGEYLKINFYTLIVATLDVKEGYNRYDDFEDVRIWFLVKAKADLQCSLKDFQIIGINQYDSCPKLKSPLSDDFVPELKLSDLDKVAEKFLKKYYPSALRTPIAINPDEIVVKMGLTKKEEKITEMGSVFGRIYFRDSMEKFYNPKNNSYEYRKVSAGTILVDPEVFFMKNIGAVNNTVIHECVHWELHRKAFELQRLFETEISHIDCSVVGGMLGREKWRSANKTEWQANQLTPRIQMPLKQFKCKIIELIHQHLKDSKVPLIDVMEQVISDVADFFRVSKMSAKIRMQEVGYEEAAGTFIWIDNHYVRPHTWQKGFLKNNQTFSIPEEELINLSFTDYDLRENKNAGYFVYVDSHLVLNSPQYVEQDSWGNLQLTDYARYHMDECCIVFDMSLKTNCRAKYHTECFFNRDRDADISLQFQYSNGLENEGADKKKAAFEEMMLRETAMLDNLPRKYSDAMNQLMKLQNMTAGQIAEEINVDIRTVKRVLNGEHGTIERLSAICLSLQLPPDVSMEVIRMSKWTLDPMNAKHRMLRYALHHLYSHKYQDIRRFLHDYNIQI